MSYDYSARSELAGSTRAARHAGTAHAIIATPRKEPDYAEIGDRVEAGHVEQHDRAAR
jgi:hypothetical protein